MVIVVAEVAADIMIVGDHHRVQPGLHLLVMLDHVPTAVSTLLLPREDITRGTHLILLSGFRVVLKKNLEITWHVKHTQL